MNSKLIGGTLLVIGTTIGAGMLALPLATAEAGFLGSLVLLVSCWAIMLVSTLLFLEVNLWLPPETNLISMAGITLGRLGQIVAWVVYLFLLYSILSAYIAGGGDLFHYILGSFGLTLPASISSVLFVALFGLVVIFGMRAVDYVNRALMLGKLGSYFLVVLLLLPFISMNQLAVSHVQNIVSSTSITVTITAFACMMIVPSLRNYFGEDIKSLRKAIFWGTFIPLICYILWNMVVMGVIPLEGEHGLKNILNSATANSDMVATLISIVQHDTIAALAKFFTSICMATSFLSVSMALSDFLADGFRLSKKSKGSILIYAATFLPPLTLVLFYPNAFIRGLQYAGISCFILMILLPAVMAWRGRYHWTLAKGYQVKGGKILLATLVLFATFMAGQGILEGIM